MNTAPIDRRVTIPTEVEPIVQPLSELRDKPYVVLVGEPGAGKSTALEYEALSEGGKLTTCREIMNGTPLSESGTAYLDALDEYRSGGDGKDKLLQLANALSTSSVQRWRITCRAEDWRVAADVNAMKRAANNEPIIVAHLRPLDEDEVLTILGAFEVTNPKKFVEEAKSRGAGAFLENPLSLWLLHSVVASNGIWPETRFDLFDKASFALAHEHDVDRATDPRPSPNAVIATTSTMCFYTLVTGAKALWHSNALPPGTTPNEYASIHDLGLDRNIAESALDTPLFRGEGHAFQPFHKTVAEFLAARYLAKRVVGAADVPALPLRRATALITGNDHKAPSELRGLYAWFTAHLHKKGDSIGACRLIERDAATVLAYGDAAAFDTAGRRSILDNLDQDDPYFLSSQNDATVFGGLAGDDLAEDFIAILDSEVRSHLQITVLQALADGPPVTKVIKKLGEIALATSRPLWIRERAAEVFVKKSVDPIAAGRLLLQELRSGVRDRNQLAVRTQILAGTPVDAIQLHEFHELLSDFDTLPSRDRDEDSLDETGSLTSLSMALQRSPRGDFFDEPIPFNSDSRQQKWQVESLLGKALSAAINTNPDIGAKKLSTWIKNIRKHPWDMIDNDVAESVQSWINRDIVRRELELFIALLDDCPLDEKPWIVRNQYISITRHIPSEAVINCLIERAKTEPKGRKRKQLFQVAAYAARGSTQWPVWRDKVVSELKREGRFKGFIKSLLSDPNEEWERKEAARRSRENEKTETARQENIEVIAPQVDAIASGSATAFGNLLWAANHYRNTVISTKKSPLEKITSLTNAEIAASLAEGFVQYAIHTDIEISIAQLGTAEAQNSTFNIEYVVAAGLHQALLHGRADELADCSLVVAFIGLRSSYFNRDGEPSIAGWAVRRLAQDSDRGADAMLQYWNAALDAGDEDLDAIYHLSNANELELVSRCLSRLLNSRPNLPELAMSQALNACAAALQYRAMASLVQRIIDLGVLDKKQRDIWKYVALALSPTEFGERLSEEELQAALTTPRSDLIKSFDELCPQTDVLDRLRISALGKTHPSSEKDWLHTDTASGMVCFSIRRLSASTSPDAGKLLMALAPDIHSSWRPQIAHAVAEHARKLRDELFVRPSINQLMNALSDGPPASPSDLAAVVLEEVARYKNTLRSGSEMPWKRFWNTDEYSAATKPQIENEDRDRLLELLRPRFERYGIAASLPEARRGEDTRVDILLLSHAGKNVPIEAKRHHNKELWTAPLDQLAGYAEDEGACGFGIYLVFWFGTEFNTPPRQDGRKRPTSARELEDILISDLPSPMKDRLTILVLDVSRPAWMIEKVNSRKQKRKKH